MLFIRHLHVSHNAPYLPAKILHNLFFSFLLGQNTAVPTEIENNAYAKVSGANKCIMGDVRMAGTQTNRLDSREAFLLGHT